jgi:hypothetical protein
LVRFSLGVAQLYWMVVLALPMLVEIVLPATRSRLR